MAIEIALRFTIPTAQVAVAVGQIADTLGSFRVVPFRLAGFDADQSHTYMTFAFTLGTPEEVSQNAPRAQAAADLISRLILVYPTLDPAFVTIPAEGSIEAECAEKQISLTFSIEQAATKVRADNAAAAAERAVARAEQAQVSADRLHTTLITVNETTVENDDLLEARAAAAEAAARAALNAERACRAAAAANEAANAYAMT